MRDPQAILLCPECLKKGGGMSLVAHDCQTCERTTTKEFKICTACALTTNTCMGCRSKLNLPISRRLLYTVRSAEQTCRRAQMQADLIYAEKMSPIDSLVTAYEQSLKAAGEEYEAAVAATQAPLISAQETLAAVQRASGFVSKDAQRQVWEARERFEQAIMQLNDAQQQKLKQVEEKLGENKALYEAARRERTAAYDRSNRLFTAKINHVLAYLNADIRYAEEAARIKAVGPVKAFNQSAA